jgi:hypothetical protein
VTPDPVQEVRQLLLSLFQNDDWQITQRAEADGRALLQSVNAFASQYAVIDYVLNLLIAGCPMHSIQRGESPGSRGVGYVMNVTNAAFQNLYIELVIEEDAA